MLADYIKNIKNLPLQVQSLEYPWNITDNAKEIILEMIKGLNEEEYMINNNICIHKKATVESNVTIKGPAIISEGCFIGASSYLREGVFLDKNVTIGPSCEIKTSFIFENNSVAHMNYVGNSMIGASVNIEAGAIIANHWNERDEKEINVIWEGKTMKTGTEKFGALVGDMSKIGANAVLSPGTILKPNSTVKRLELVE
jgi:UDP-N-acetylglucosamine diphosphorylase / glucose-1-phosphate thymidylyltransferase / UDP-N-acetylgalactosamine diphosphorylase / glucosamine-1-phosphate N-acetyltransferase / galactosamine-1-phosphate N-acetyltransferase